MLFVLFVLFVLCVCVWNLLVKKIKRFKIALITSFILLLKAVSMGQAQNEKKNLFGRNNKSRSLAFRNFLFHQNIICFGWVMSLFLFVWCLFIKKESFPAKTAVFEYITLTVKCFLSSQYFEICFMRGFLQQPLTMLGPQKQEILQCLCFCQILPLLPFGHLNICN